jgi:hypothetical protein
MKVGEAGAVNDAMRIHLNQDLLDLVISQMNEVINSVTKPIVYGPIEGNEILSLLGFTEPILENPIFLDVYPFGDVYIDKSVAEPNLTGLINIGNITIVPDIVQGNKILASVIISPTEGIDPDGPAALYIQGCHDQAVIKHHFALGVNEVRVENAEITLYMDATGAIGAKLDLTKGAIVIDGIKLEYDILSLRSKVLDWLLNTVIKKFVLSSLSIDFGFMNVSDLSFDFMDIGLGLWPMNPSIITTTDDYMNVDLGISAAYSGLTPAIPGLDTFYATPGDVLPELSKTADENIILAISDDMMNETALALVQTGILSNLDLSDLISGLVASISKEPAEMYVSLMTPPVLDLSGSNPKKKIFADKLTSLGCISMRDLIVELRLKAGKMPIALRLAIDADAYLMLKIKENGNIGVTIDKSKTDFKIKILYMNGINTLYIPAFGRIIINEVLSLVLDEMVDVSLPAFDLIGKSRSIEIVSAEAKDNFLTGKAKLIIK